MDRIEAMRIFVAALDEGSLAAAGRVDAATILDLSQPALQSFAGSHLTENRRDGEEDVALERSLGSCRD